MNRTVWIGILGLLVVAGVVFVAVRGRDDDANVVDQPAPSVDADKAYERAVEALDRKQIDLARIWLEKVLVDDPAHVMARLYLGQIKRDSGDADAARELWSSITTGTPEELATARYLEGMLAVSESDILESERLFLTALEHNPDYLEPHEQLVNVYRMLRRPNSLMDQLKEIKRLRPLTPLELSLRTLPLRSGYPPKETFKVLQNSFATGDTDPASIQQRAACLDACFELQQFDEILQLTKNFQQSKPGIISGYRALAFVELGQFAEADAMIREFKSSESDWRLRFAEGRVAEEQEEWERARDCFKDAYQAEPNERTNTYRYGRILQRLGDPGSKALLDRAVLLDELERVCLRVTQASNANSAQITPIAEKIAETLAQLERYGESAEWLRLVMRLDSNAKDYREQIASLESQIATKTPSQPTPEVHPPTHVAGNPSNSTDQIRQSTQMPGRIQFRDVAGEVGLDFQYFNGDTGKEHLIESMGGGVFVIDFDRDGWEDLYFPQGSSIPGERVAGEHRDEFWRNLGGERFQQITAAASLGATGYGLGGTVFDFNEDGFDDVLVTNMGRNLLYMNNGDGTFSELSEESFPGGSAMSTSATAADFNGDQLLDLYIANYVQELKTCPQPDGSYLPCDPDSFTGEPDQLLINLGVGQFADLSELAGIQLENSKGLGVIAADFDEDGRPDIYVANDGVPNFLFINETDSETHTVRFREWGLQSGSAVDELGRSQAGMGLVAADFNGDELIDLFVTNFYQEYNTLYLNQGDHFFLDASRESGLAEFSLPYLGFGTQAADFDGDGRLDLAVANGHIARDVTGKQPWKMPAQVFQGDGKGRFEEASTEAGEYFSEQVLGRGTALLDWNHDACPDLVIVHQDRAAVLLENSNDQQPETISLQLIGSKSCRNAAAAVIAQKFADGSRSPKYRQSNGNYLSSSSRDILMPVDTAEPVELTVHWPSGRVTTHVVASGNEMPLTDSRWMLLEDGRSLGRAQ
ncbi:MAG: VCBS repeat-containing protein [Planctomycetaceae bacterium]|nr:VCBS repeat-containing protein [Planctomycetaceae bacterium]MCB9950228.1 VCBS repeat-containing protein [Planctomycetaceae bacterium]